MADANKKKGVSLAKGPVALIGLALLIYGVTAFILGGHSFRTEPVSGTVNGETWLGLEVNAWTSLLFIGAGLLLLFGAPLHWGAKGMSLIVGLVLGAASVIALYDGDDVFGIFAANGLTALVWGVAAAVLLVLALLPRVGKDKGEDHDRARVDDRPVERERIVEREPEGRLKSETPVTGETPASRPVGSGDVVAPASGTTPESQATSRRQREHGEF